MTVVISADEAPSPGDIRWVGSGTVIELHSSARDREDWPSLLAALPNAVARGADVVWRG